MSRFTARFTSTFGDKDDSGDENKTVFADESVPVFPCYNLYPRSSKLSVSGNSARLKSINLNDNNDIEEDTLPIRRIGARKRDNPFKKYQVPDEIVDVIFSNLRKRDLLSAMQVCQQFYAVGHVSRNWTITDVMERPITELTLITLMKRKIRILRLAGAKPDPISRVNVRMFASCMLGTSRIECLDLSRANLTVRQLLILLKPCRKLQCLSVEGNVLDDQVASCISDNKNLRELDISMTRGISINGARMISQKCNNLEQLNASWCGLSEPILRVIIDNITDKLRKLNLSGSIREDGLNDELVDAFSSKADNITDLDLSDNGQLGDAVVATIMARFPKLTHLSLNRCYAMDPNIIVHLNIKPSLIFLNVHGCITENNMKLFLQMCDRLKCNTQLFNFTAKPTSNNAPFIWGHNMLEY
ncbi:CRE-SKPT-1 protein [Caenorhabditis remanei]|uniref:CRE-SKPT-1 protein n=1 Tax=Caenorhabditis remanei TaxID=31234 RepID=E3LZ44_CAERE|nr:CRE-SKPT-1 protein [Caenorhabditis remanei]